jgi:hypothetical protein
MNAYLTAMNNITDFVNLKEDLKREITVAMLQFAIEYLANMAQDLNKAKDRL